MWLLWSGHYPPLLLSFGALSCALAVFIAYRMHTLEEGEHPIRLGLRFIAYSPWLLGAIVKSNIDVAHRILKPSFPISPNLVRLEVSQETELGQAIYANSITLTPGTVTLLLSDGILTVHALTQESAAELQSGDMDRRVARVEGQH
tara:strand:- start:282 stop:719 length:438 start_codon:yes stop_codon:yes gene_type:complete